MCFCVWTNMSILWRDPLCVLTAWSIVSRAGSELPLSRWMLMNLRQIISSSSKTVQNKLFCHNNHQLYVGKRRKRWTKSWKNKSIVLTTHNKILYLWQYLDLYVFLFHDENKKIHSSPLPGQWNETGLFLKNYNTLFTVYFTAVAVKKI